MKTNFRKLIPSSLSILGIAVLAGCGGGGTAQPTVVATDLASAYSVTLVQAPAGTTLPEFTGISADGKQICGDVTEGDNLRTFRYTNGSIKLLTPADRWVRPNAINSGGSIAATTSETVGEMGCAIFGNNPTYFPIQSGEDDSWAYNVDEAGSVYRCTHLSDGSYRTYGVKGANSTPVTVNGDANFAVRSVSAGGRMMGWSGSKYMAFDPTSSTWSEVLAGQAQISPSSISDDGTLVGNQKVGGKWVSFVCKGGTVMNFADSTSTYATLTAISAGGIAVGSDTVLVGASQVNRAYAWTQASGYVDLNTRFSEPGFIAYRAYGVSSNGKIVGYGYKNGEKVGFILTPKSSL